MLCQNIAKLTVCSKFGYLWVYSCSDHEKGRAEMSTIEKLPLDRMAPKSIIGAPDLVIEIAFPSTAIVDRQV